MHLYIVAQYLNLQGPGEDRFIKLGRKLFSDGHQVTVFSGTTGVDFDLNQKKIGLYRDDGLTMVVLNVPYDRQMSNLMKLKSYIKFLRMVEWQAKLLPKPDLMLVSTPPLSAAIPAIKLKKHFKIPLVLEVRELWPDAPIQRGTLRNRLLKKWAYNLEDRVYTEADRIIASGTGIADVLKETMRQRAKVDNIPDGLNEDDLLAGYLEALSKIDGLGHLNPG